MIRLLAAVFLFAGFNAAADTEVPHTFQEGEVIDAQKFNEDFNALEAAIDANADSIEALPMPPTDCTTRQIIKWNGSAWVCSTREAVFNYLAGPTDFAVAYCPPPKQVTGGSCKFGGEFCGERTEYPSFELDGWMCDSGTTSCFVEEIVAICQ